MPPQNPFVEYLLELMQAIPAVTAKRMFGGYGLFRAGLMFGLVADDVLYLKVDEENRAEFEARGLEPFVYLKDGKPMPMSYYQAPGEALDDPDAMTTWADLAYAAAVRAAAAKAKPKAKKRKQPNG
jgi:DNA transformation protein and related proteins